MVVDVAVTHHGKENSYVFFGKGKEIALMPLATYSNLTSINPPKNPTFLIISGGEFQESIRDIKFVMVFLLKEATIGETLLPKAIQDLLAEFPDLVPHPTNFLECVTFNIVWTSYLVQVSLIYCIIV